MLGSPIFDPQDPQIFTLKRTDTPLDLAKRAEKVHCGGVDHEAISITLMVTSIHQVSSHIFLCYGPIPPLSPPW